MRTNLSLNDMIFQYSEKPFIDEKMFKLPVFSEVRSKPGIVGKLYQIVSNLISRKEPEAKSSGWKRVCEAK